MALTKVNSVGIATGISLTGVTTTQDAKVGTGITLSPDGDGYYTGIITATSYRGDVSNCTGVGQTNFIDAESLNVSGISTFTGQATVGTGITLSPDGDVFFTGVVTATSYAGDGSALTGIAATDNVRTGILDVAGVGTFRDNINVADRIIHVGDTNTQIRFPTADTVTVETGGTERIRVDSGGRLLIATTDIDSVSDGEVSKLIVKSTDSTASATFVRHSADAAGSGIYIGKSRNATVGSNTIVQSGDELGRITFSGDDGTNINTLGARIQAFVDGTPGENDMPGRLTFSTTADGAASVTERLRIASDGDATFGTGMQPGASVNIISDKNVETGVDDMANYHLVLKNPQNDTGEAVGLAFGITDTAAKVGAAILHERDAAGSQGSLKFLTRPDNSGPPVERMRIRADGDIVIGTTTWSYTKPLNVQGSSGAILSLANYDTTTYAQDTNTSIELRIATGNTNNQNGAVEIRGFKENGTNGDNARGINFWTSTNGGSNTERMRISSAGYVTKPNQPAFHANNNGQSNQNMTDDASAKITFPTEVFDVGGCYDTSNSRFTAPVAGKYYFNLTLYTGFASSLTACRVIHGRWKKNGSDVANWNGFGGTNDDGGHQWHPTFSDGIFLSLAADDYIEVFLSSISVSGSGSAYVNNSTGTHFSGWLVC